MQDSSKELAAWGYGLAVATVLCGSIALIQISPSLGGGEAVAMTASESEFALLEQPVH